MRKFAPCTFLNVTRTCAFRHDEHVLRGAKKTRRQRSSTEILYARVALIMLQLIQQTACENSLHGRFLNVTRTCAFRHDEHDFDRSKKTRRRGSSTEILYARVALIMLQLIQQTACEKSLHGRFWTTSKMLTSVILRRSLRTTLWSVSGRRSSRMPQDRSLPVH
jgi:hypothetical protein